MLQVGGVLRLLVKFRRIRFPHEIIAGLERAPEALERTIRGDYLGTVIVKLWSFGYCGQYSIHRDTFITLALSSEEDPGWIDQVCGTSEDMISRHFRRCIPG